MFELQTACFRLPWLLLQPLFWLAVFGLPPLVFYGRRLYAYRVWRADRIIRLRGALEAALEMDQKMLAGDRSYIGTPGKASGELREKIAFMERQWFALRKYVAKGEYVQWYGWAK